MMIISRAVTGNTCTCRQILAKPENNDRICYLKGKGINCLIFRLFVISKPPND